MRRQYSPISSRCSPRRLPQLSSYLHRVRCRRRGSRCCLRRYVFLALHSRPTMTEQFSRSILLRPFAGLLRPSTPHSLPRALSRDGPRGDILRALHSRSPQMIRVLTICAGPSVLHVRSARTYSPPGSRLHHHDEPHHQYALITQS